MCDLSSMGKVGGQETEYVCRQVLLLELQGRWMWPQINKLLLGIIAVVPVSAAWLDGAFYCVTPTNTCSTTTSCLLGRDINRMEFELHKSVMSRDN